ncbi:MAG: hypothetical protein DWQ41_27290 [Planctomycetota bacterium]|nr:MAG: hypothetical protein DWQ41_27290 [Planctomycetota bacterium]
MQVMSCEQSNAEQGILAVVGHNFQIAPLSNPIDPACVAFQSNLGPVRKNCLHRPRLLERQPINLLLWQYQIAVESCVDPYLSFVHSRSI